MTKQEWIHRYADRLMAVGGFEPTAAIEAAEAAFDGQTEPGFEFNEMAAYNPEACADAELEELASQQ